MSEEDKLMSEQGWDEHLRAMWADQANKLLVLVAVDIMSIPEVSWFSFDK